MSQSDRGGFRGDVRAASEIIGYALLVGIVFLSALLIVVYGSSLITDAQNSVNEQSAELVIQELDSKLSTLSSLSDVQRIRFDLGDTAPRDLRVEQGGFVNITVDERVATCQARLDMSSLRYEAEENRIVGYEAGGVWRGVPDGGTVMLTSPDVTFQNGSVNANIVNVTGRITESTNEAVLNASFSDDLTKRKMNRLTTGDCVRPDNVTIKINGSTFYRAWGAYFEDEFGNARTFESNQTVLTRLEQSDLREVANDFKNNVINLSQENPPDYMNGGATIEADPSDNTPARIRVDKGAGNTYTVQYQPLANATSFSVSNQETVVKSISQDGVGTDAVFILDDSGSMGNLFTSTPDDRDRLPAAQTAAARSLVVLNDSDRVGLVSYDSDSIIFSTDGKLLTTDREDPYFSDYDNLGDYYAESTPGEVNTGAGGFNGTLQELEEGGTTCIYCSLNSAFQVFGVASNQSRNQTIILLTDGQNNVYTDKQVLDLAETANARNITINTVRIGGSPGGSFDDCSSFLLQCIADRTGGSYLATNDQDKLREFFKSSLTTTEKEDVVRRTAISTNATTSGGQIYDPYVAGDTDGMATAQNNFLNINDPMAPSTFKHAFAVDDGESVYLNASWYGCTDKETPGSGSPEGAGQPKANWTATPLVRDGKTVYRCNDPNPDDVHNISDENVTIYLDGHVVGAGQTESNPGGDPDEWSEYLDYEKGISPNLGDPQGAPLLNNSSRPWQTNMTSQLEDYLVTREVDYDTSDGDTEYVWELNLSSNEAIVVYNYSVADEKYDDNNRLALIYRIGLSEAEAQPESIINVRVNKVELGEDG
jgi:Mg-chelatase subunit ChlD